MDYYLYKLKNFIDKWFLIPLATFILLLISFFMPFYFLSVNGTFLVSVSFFQTLCQKQLDFINGGGGITPAIRYKDIVNLLSFVAIFICTLLYSIRKKKIYMFLAAGITLSLIIFDILYTMINFSISQSWVDKRLPDIGFFLLIALFLLHVAFIALLLRFRDNTMPQKPIRHKIQSDKQRIAALEREVAELKANRKDDE